MRLDFILGEKIECGEDVEIPKRENSEKANFYKLKGGKINFFYNSRESNIPKEANKIRFPLFHKNQYQISYGNPFFA